jgi:hypothetical protein
MVTKLNSPATKKDLIHGHAGVHAMKTGETSWTTTIISPVLIIDQDPKPSPYKTCDIFDLLILKYQKLYDYFKYVNSQAIPVNGSPLYLNTKDLLQSANLTINAEGVETNLTFLNKYTQMFDLVAPDKPANTTKNTQSNYVNFIARKAKFYDVKFYIPADNIEFTIQSGSIDIKIEYNKLFFINYNTSIPFYEPKGYSISGSVELIIPADLWPTLLKPKNNNNDQILPGQSLLRLFTKNINCSIILADGRRLDIGLATLTTELSFELQASGIGVVKVRFETFAANF